MNKFFFIILIMLVIGCAGETQLIPQVTTADSAELEINLDATVEAMVGEKLKDLIPTPTPEILIKGGSGKLKVKEDEEVEVEVKIVIQTPTPEPTSTPEKEKLLPKEPQKKIKPGFECPKAHRQHQNAHQSWFKSAKEHIQVTHTSISYILLYIHT